MNIIRKKYILKNLKKIIFSNYKQKKGFFRNIFIIEFRKYKKVDMGGKYKNSINGNVNNKIDFLSSVNFLLQ